jgi:predicted nicotinamide N-methyase
MSSCVARVQLRRSPPSVIPKKKRIHVEVILASEFADSIPGLLDVYSINVSLAAPTQQLKRLCVLETVATIRNEIVHMVIDPPPELGTYRLLFDVTKNDSVKDIDAIVLPLLTDTFEMVEKEILGSLRSMPSLCSWRLVGDLQILEEYGKTLGSHIYDSSVIMLQYLMKSLHDFSFRGVAVELGSGCGLLSIWLSKYYAAVLATDKSYQLPLIRENIKCNEREQNCFVKDLDWVEWPRSDVVKTSVLATIQELREMNTGGADSTEKSSLVIPPVEHAHTENGDASSAYDKGQSDSAAFQPTTPSNADVDLILGADVLYDRSVADAFFNVVRDLASVGTTTILIAQKIRKSDREGGNSLERVDVRSVEGFSATEVACEANVVIWSMVKL